MALERANPVARLAVAQHGLAVFAGAGQKVAVRGDGPGTYTRGGTVDSCAQRAPATSFLRHVCIRPAGVPGQGAGGEGGRPGERTCTLAPLWVSYAHDRLQGSEAAYTPLLSAAIVAGKETKQKRLVGLTNQD